MVSSQHGGDLSTSLTVRGAQSVVGVSGSGGRSGGSHLSSRARRYGRSHIGGSTFVPQNEFPVFSHSGDVEIVVRVASGHENRYLLHRHTLTRCSGFFEASTSNEWSRAQAVPAVPELPALPNASSGAGTGNEVARIEERRESSDNGSRSAVPPSASLAPLKKRWRYELDTGTGDDDIPMLVQKEETPSTSHRERERDRDFPPTSTASIFGGPSNSSSRHAHSNSGSSNHKSSFFRSVANLSLSHSHSSHYNQPPPLPPPTQAEADLLRDYDNLFRIMYNYPPLLDAINIADAYVQCKSLLQLADQYDALPVVGPRVDHHLLQFQSRLWRQIAKYPISYLRLGYLARSKVIFQEALIHVVGQWPAGERSIRAAMPDVVLDIIEDKVDELEEMVGRIEARLFRLTLTTSSHRGGGDRERTTTREREKVTPQNGYLDWLAVSFFRQWVAENTVPVSSSMYASGGAGVGGLYGQQQQMVPDRRHREGRNRGGSTSDSSADNSGNTSSRRRVHMVLPHGSAAGGGGTPTPLAALGRTYRVLGGGAGDKSYLTHDECKRFLKLTPDLYSRDNLRRFEKRIDELKAMAREVVRPLMGSGLELETSSGRDGTSGGQGGGGFAVGYLTCTTVRERELPWDVYD
ncbi:hypothetical protein V8F33_004390 [Rhypophila sp. PSN 637]